ncbi:hypothetical protein [Bacillus sp. FJAT-44742]|nr:hypothetical protein [Bacillus sp. FJAT-44742]
MKGKIMKRLTSQYEEKRIFAAKRLKSLLSQKKLHHMNIEHIGFLSQL